MEALKRLYERERAAYAAAKNRDVRAYLALMADTLARLESELAEFRALDKARILRIAERVLRDFPRSEHAPRFVLNEVDGLRGVVLSAKNFVERREAQLVGLIDKINSAKPDDFTSYSTASLAACDKREAACLLGGSKPYAGNGFIDSMKELTRAVEDAVARAGIRVGTKPASSTGYIKQPRGADEDAVDSSYWSVFDE